MNVRDFAARITELGYPVSYGSVNAYERVETAGKIPAAYLAVIAREFGKNPAWLLLGDLPEDAIPPDASAALVEKMREILRRPVTDMPASRFRPEPLDDETDG